MSVADTRAYPFLRKEMRLIELVLLANRPVLGICLGSQLLASVLGAPVSAGPSKEIGWYPVWLTDAGKADPVLGSAPSRFTALHWHGDVFDLPHEATSLASSAMTPHQAFCWRQRAYGLLFHLEVTHEQLVAMVGQFREELHQANIPPAAILADVDDHLAQLQAFASGVFARWRALLPR